jgi:hypothetical protein
MTTAQKPTPPYRPSFDPKKPLERTTLRNVRATGVGQASPARLNGFIILGTLGAAVIRLAIPTWWVLATPLVCLACFGLWGRSAQHTQMLNVRHERKLGLRRALTAVRWLAVALGAGAAVAGLVGTVMILLEPGRL